MTLTLALPPAVEVSLMREAVRQGVPMDIYALRVLEQHVLPQSRSDPRSPSSPLALAPATCCVPRSPPCVPRSPPLSGIEFMRRWSLHILPKGFTKTRSYGGFSCRHRQDYLQRCRQLLQIPEPE
ncbi:MAG TPA: transposase, partial [Pirellulaceae bacterium]|nr:transposase [Pirellulaceae bacterium]